MNGLKVRAARVFIPRQTSPHLRIEFTQAPRAESPKTQHRQIYPGYLCDGETGSGEAFEDLARTFSQSPTAADGGDLGEFEKETLSPQIQASLDGLKQGQISTVLDTDQGFQLFYIEAVKRSEGIPLDSVRGEIQQKLFKEVVDKKFISWLEDLRSQSHIKIIN